MKIEVIDGSGNPIQIEIGRTQHDALQATVGERVYVTPKRVRVFTSE